MKQGKRLVTLAGLLLLLEACLGGSILENRNEQADSSNTAHRSSRYLAEAAKDYSFRERLNQYAAGAKKLQDCNLPEELVKKIQSYQPIADQIIELIVRGEFKGRTYDELATFVDLYPIRQSGFENLENSIDYMMNRMEELGMQNVRGEQVLVPHWVR